LTRTKTSINTQTPERNLGHEKTRSAAKSECSSSCGRQPLPAPSGAWLGGHVCPHAAPGSCSPSHCHFQSVHTTCADRTTLQWLLPWFCLRTPRTWKPAWGFRDQTLSSVPSHAVTWARSGGAAVSRVALCSSCPLQQGSHRHILIVSKDGHKMKVERITCFPKPGHKQSRKSCKADWSGLAVTLCPDGVT
jgi:hypothetical protein